MHPISLKFLDQDNEAKFQIANEEKFKSQYKWLVFSLIIAMSILDILEIIDKNYTQVGFNSAFLIVLFVLSWALQINSERALKIVEMFNNSFCLPPALNILTSIYNLIEFKTGIALVLMSMLYAHTYNKNYNIVQTSISMVVFIFICIGHISYLIGFTPYYFIILGPIILTISQMYSTIKIERLNFSQSLVNQSLVDVITKVCKENIIIFTYNLEQHKYEKEIINETAQFYFNTDILSDILKEIHIKSQREDKPKSRIYIFSQKLFRELNQYSATYKKESTDI